MDFEKTFPLRYWINLGRRQDRRVEMAFALNEAGITAERFPAVDSRFVRRNRGYESAGRYALAVTQRLALKAAALRKADAVLIMEDDVVFHPQIIERLKATELPDDWGIFYLGCAHMKRPHPVSHGIVRTGYALDTHAFAVRAPYYRKVMAALSVRYNQPVGHARASDWFLANLHEEIPTYACYPNLAWQAVATSDLIGVTYSNYTAEGEQISGRGEMIGLQGEIWGARRWGGWSRPELSAEAGRPRSPSEVLIAAQPTAPVQAEPKLGLLFLTRGDVNQPVVWSEFMAETNGAVRVFSHPKDAMAARRGFLADSVINEWHETEWGDISLVRAMNSLLKAGLEDQTLTHFAFVSESCVPIRPWLEIKRRLAIDPRSRLDVLTGREMKSKHRDRIAGVADLPSHCHRAHPQWCLLDREAAACVAEVDLTPRFELMKVADEHYIGSVLSLRGYDERRLRREAITWVAWVENEWMVRPEVYSETSRELAAELSSFNGFFARKFTECSDVGKWGLHHMAGLAVVP